MRPGHIIKLLRTAEGISQKEMATRLEVSSTYLCQIEREQREPGLPFLKKAAHELKIPMPLLVFDEKDDVDTLLPDLQKTLTDLLSARLRLTAGASSGE